MGLSEGHKILPRAPGYRKLHRWASEGVIASGGTRIYLETIKVGGERCTSVEAYHRFCGEIAQEESA